MGFNEVREVRTTYTCDFCKHAEVSVSEYGQNFNIPKGWSALAIVPADQRPDYAPVHNPYPSYSEKPRYCLSGDRGMNVAIACPDCSVYGLQIIKRKQAELEPQKVAQPKTNRFLLVMYAAMIVSLMAGFALGLLFKK